MKLVRFAITAAVVAGLSAPALAQEGSSQPVTNPPAAANTNPPVNQPVGYTSSDSNRNWVVSGFLGTNFGSSRVNTNLDLEGLENFDTGSTSANFGGQFAYLGRRVIGAEFLADFSPRIGTFNNILFERSPNVNSYMFNAVAVAPFGHVHSFDPYISGGIGWVTMSATIFTVDPTLAPNINAIGTESVSGSRFAWDLGGGVMAWSEKNWGFRGDLRYYRTTSSSSDVLDLNNIGNGDVFTRVELSGISFWKANAGISFRW
jgi:opacity protein-like surface antigen